MSLEMKQACEKCARALENMGEAYICSFECSFCQGCASDMRLICPNCGGELVARPRRNPARR